MALRRKSKTISRSIKSRSKRRSKSISKSYSRKSRKGHSRKSKNRKSRKTRGGCGDACKTAGSEYKTDGVWTSMTGGSGVTPYSMQADIYKHTTDPVFYSSV